jgi:hypothetical protein
MASGSDETVTYLDTTNATADDRIKIYINGTRYTGPWDSEVVPSLNQDTNIMNTDPQKIGTRPANADYFNGVMAHVHLIDGTHMQLVILVKQIQPQEFGLQKLVLQ